MDLNKKLEKVFKYSSLDNRVQEIIDRGYVASKPENKNILFVGMNPSYISGSVPESYIYDVDKAVKDYPRHYMNFESLISKTRYKDDWTYIDLFFFRETDQKKLELFFKNDIKFIVDQLLVTHEIIKFINPKIIVVANMGAANFFGINKVSLKENLFTNIWFGLNFFFDKVTGMYKVNGIDKNSILQDKDVNNYNDKHFLFTSTLKYMNRFEKERTAWIIDKI